MMFQLPTAIDSNVSTARKVVKRRKLDSRTDEETSPNTDALETNPQDATVSICSSCHRTIARAGNPWGGAVVVSCARCSKPTCVICSRKCEGPSSVPSTTPSTDLNTVARSNPLLSSLPQRHVPRKTVPMRRRPLHTNACITNQKNPVENRDDAANASIPQMWPRKHDMQSLGAEHPDAKADVCSFGTGATFCKSCVKEDIVSGSIVCFGCVGHSRT